MRGEKKTAMKNFDAAGAQSFRQLTIWDVIQQCEHPTYSVKSLFAGCGSGIHTGMYEAVKQLYQIEDVIKKIKGQYEMNVPNYWVTG